MVCMIRPSISWNVVLKISCRSINCWRLSMKAFTFNGPVKRWSVPLCNLLRNPMIVSTARSVPGQTMPGRAPRAKHERGEVVSQARSPSSGVSCRVIDHRRGETELEKPPPLVRVSREVPVPASFVQERIWRYSQSSDSAAGYMMADRPTFNRSVERECLHGESPAIDRPTRNL